jgi:hypothetical protein
MVLLAILRSVRAADGERHSIDEFLGSLRDIRHISFGVGRPAEKDRANQDMANDHGRDEVRPHVEKQALIVSEDGSTRRERLAFPGTGNVSTNSSLQIFQRRNRKFSDSAGFIHSQILSHALEYPFSL